MLYFNALSLQHNQLLITQTKKIMKTYASIAEILSEVFNAKNSHAFPSGLYEKLQYAIENSTEAEQENFVEWVNNEGEPWGWGHDHWSVMFMNNPAESFDCFLD
jgi:hypothetical protein